MINFKNKILSSDFNKIINPIDIYENLDRKSITGPLRPVQINILNDWFNYHYDDKDLIIKLHTGEGKTLIGLLILLSKLNKTGKPCLYLCPNKYLVQQVCQEAIKFGIPYCDVKEDRELPSNFTNGENILITTSKKLFNGKSKFGLNNSSIKIENIILDDSHACIESIISSFTIKIEKGKPVYSKLLALFEEDLRNQGEGSYFDVISGTSDTILPIPYWAWIDKKSEITQILSDSKADNEIAFIWPLIKDYIDKCQSYISGKYIEISPYSIPIEIFGSFSKANQRILMSATTQEDSFFIKGLNFSLASVRTPLTVNDQKWSGEKMILIPFLIKEELERELIITKFAQQADRQFGVFCLVPSNKKAELYKERGSVIASSENITNIINNIKSGNYSNTIVLVNRYDGIDLPDENCRILIIDSLPYFDSLFERYEELCRSTSDIVNIKIAQKIEQGLGRSVRGEKDYTVILLIGSELERFVKSKSTNKYFSAQTKRQIDIGLMIADLAQEDLKKEAPFVVLMSLVNQSLKRDEGWKEFYKEEMNKLYPTENETNLYKKLEIEKLCESYYYFDDNVSAYNAMQIFIDESKLDDQEKGWYLQMLARYNYCTNKSESNIQQKSAFKNNLQLLKPKDGVNYHKIELISDNRISNIKTFFKYFNSWDEFSLTFNDILDNLLFGVNAEKFEMALCEIGKFLGFVSQRPDKEIRKGPDNLWGGVENKYFLFECKSEVDQNRDEINKAEAGQMNSHSGWFESEYGDSIVRRILVIPTKNLSYYADFTHEVVILRKGGLRKLKTNIKSFITELKSYTYGEITDTKIQQALDSHKLSIDNLWNEYFETYYKKSYNDK